MISKSEIEQLLSLSRMEISEAEKEELRKDVASILSYVDQIKTAPVLEVEQSQQSVNVMREDAQEHMPGEFTEKLIGAAPESEDNQIKVKKIL